MNRRSTAMTLGMVLGSCCLEQTWLAAAETLRRLRSGATNYRRLAADPFTISLVRLTLIGHLRARCAATHFRRLRAAGPTKTAGIAREKKMKNGSTPQVPSPSLPMPWLMSPSLDSHSACDLSVPQAIGAHLASRPGPLRLFLVHRSRQVWHVTLIRGL